MSAFTASQTANSDSSAESISNPSADQGSSKKLQMTEPANSLFKWIKRVSKEEYAEQTKQEVEALRLKRKEREWDMEKSRLTQKIDE